MEFKEIKSEESNSKSGDQFESPIHYEPMQVSKEIISDVYKIRQPIQNKFISQKSLDQLKSKINPKLTLSQRQVSNLRQVSRPRYIFKDPIYMQ